MPGSKQPLPHLFYACGLKALVWFVLAISMINKQFIQMCHRSSYTGIFTNRVRRSLILQKNTTSPLKKSGRSAIGFVVLILISQP